MVLRGAALLGVLTGRFWRQDRQKRTFDTAHYELSRNSARTSHVSKKRSASPVISRECINGVEQLYNADVGVDVMWLASGRIGVLFPVIVQALRPFSGVRKTALKFFE
jgi:hypothetical protein